MTKTPDNNDPDQLDGEDSVDLAAAKITKRKGVPPPPLTGDQRTRWDRILRNLDDERRMGPTDRAALALILRETKANGLWAFTRDIIIIIMLLLLLGVVVWRALLTENRYYECGGEVMTSQNSSSTMEGVGL